MRGLYDQFTRLPVYNVVIIGLDNAGKTTLLERIKLTLAGRAEDTVSVPAPTIGLNVCRCRMDGAQVQFWDLGGAEDLHGLWAGYYAESHVVMFVVDSMDTVRLERSLQVLNLVLREDLLEGVPVAVLANKQDLHGGAADVASMKEMFNPSLARWSAREGKVFAVSAVSGAGMGEVVGWLRRVVALNAVQRPAK